MGLDEILVKQKFKDVLRFIADRSNVELKPPARLAYNDRLHLVSEQVAPRDEFLSITTTDSVQQFVQAWWDEFRRRDFTPTAQRAHKPGQPFKSASNKPSLRPYFSGDDVLSIEPLNKPAMNVAWLPQLGKKAELGDSDFQHFERQVRAGLRVSNFMEALLQAWKYDNPNELLLAKIANAMVHATKTLLQIQSAQLGQFVQLRRDLYLLNSSASMDVLQTLRHAPLLGHDELFPRALLCELDDRVKRTFETSLLVHTFKTTQAKKANDKPNKWPEQQRDWGRSEAVTHMGTQVVATPSFEHQSDSGFHFLPHDTWKSQLGLLEAHLATHKQLPVGGRLGHYWSKWRGIGAPKRVYKWFKKGYRLPFAKNQQRAAEALMKTECPDGLLSSYGFGTIKAKALAAIIQTLLEKKAIEEVPLDTPVVFNRVFLRQKAPKSRQTCVEFRLIIDLTQVNKHLRLTTFQMETPAVIRRAIRPGMWATSIDFSDAFHHIPIHRSYYRFLAFQVDAKKYWYTVCPFGLSPIPQVFTAAMAPLKHHVRDQMGITIFQYLDDWLLLFSEPIQAAEQTLRFAELCIELGLLVNLDKSELCPTQLMVHLGIEWDLARAWVRPAPKTCQNIAVGAEQILRAGRAKLSHMESLRGKMVAAEKQTHLGRIHFRVFQELVTRALKHRAPPTWVNLSLPATEDLAWWAHLPNIVRGVPCVPPKPAYLISTDASVRGWGAFESGRSLSGLWAGTDRRLHINHKELLTVHMVLTQWAHRLAGHPVHFRMDNKTAVSYLCRQGGTRSSSLTQTAKRILELADSFNISISASYIAGSLNALADIQSRAGQVLKTEWCLSKETFQWVVANNFFGQPEVDLFANHLTAQLPRYGSPNPDPYAEIIDALTAPWPKAPLYAFPPTTIMEQVVTKIQQERPKSLLLLTPVVKSATWWPFLSTWRANSMELPTSIITLQQPHFHHEHPDPASLCLTLFHISYDG